MRISFDNWRVVIGRKRPVTYVTLDAERIQLMDRTMQCRHAPTNLMKLATVLLLGLLIRGSVRAADVTLIDFADFTQTCYFWKYQDETSKIDVMHGFLMGIEAAKVTRQFWPVQFRISAVISELDLRCAEPQNQDKKIPEMMSIIATEINSKR